ncbi:hypothetical protein K437DRAFT_270014 [Tilletiaria anomala UBC 951]|uniref:Pkinase-domain-containing protein n=1 Tax=Tilletiaria anomala (strain ATCC 24038 / CBS 436.72 / UBC 951) TaxID=1037660 RepID=A0A066VJA1_TILAU|nr:uncharacterized protein K437DRAFT_270014 [Tilletiaria anomala UBC 951]KDN40353.1 hypothetical protein K437DRAFT_270014 [Tilletiaria anomala UBC 951]
MAAITQRPVDLTPPHSPASSFSCKAIVASGSPLHRVHASGTRLSEGGGSPRKTSVSSGDATGRHPRESSSRPRSPRARAITMAAAMRPATPGGALEQSSSSVASVSSCSSSQQVPSPLRFPEMAESSQESLVSACAASVADQSNNNIVVAGASSVTPSDSEIKTQRGSISFSDVGPIEIPSRRSIGDYRRSKRVSTPTTPSYPPSSRRPSYQKTPASNHNANLSPTSPLDFNSFSMLSQSAGTAAPQSTAPERQVSRSSRSSADTGSRSSARTSGERSSADEAAMPRSSSSPHRKEGSSESSTGNDSVLIASAAKGADEPQQHPLAYHKLDMASFSTPELHLASDPLISMEEPRYHLRISQQVLGKGPPPMLQTKVRAASIDETLRDGVNGFSSLTAVIGALAKSSNAHKRQQGGDLRLFSTSFSSFARGDRPPVRERKSSIATIVRKASSAATKSRLGSGAEPSENDANGPIGSKGNPAAIVTHNTNGSRSASGRQRLSGSGFGYALSNASNWIKRPRRWSTQGGRLPSGSSAQTDSRIASVAPTLAAADRILHEVKALTSENAEAEGDGVDAKYDVAEAMSKLRAARRYLSAELSAIRELVDPQDRSRIDEVAWKDSGDCSDEAWAEEQLAFWRALSDGVLLSLLANKLCPGSVEKIDRRDVEWVKADNISRFLKAARDELGLASRDLFQCFDITDSTTEGLQRAVLTILAIEKAGSNSKGRCSGMYLQGRPISLQRLSASNLASRSSLDISFDSMATAESPHGSPARAGSQQSSRLSVLQQRKEAERILVSGAGNSDAATSSAVSDDRTRRRRSGELGNNVSTRSITFADNVKSSAGYDEEQMSSRLPYRDRKLSESALSLTEVAEEPEEIMSSPRAPTPPEPSQLPPSSLSTQFPTSSAMTRTSSQRRISMELQLGFAAASSENLDDWRAAITATPVRHTPHRRHSGVGRSTPSPLNPQRDSLASPTVHGNGSPLPSPRLPFPRSASSTDSPGAKRLHRHLSLSGAASASEASLAVTLGSPTSPTSLTSPTRPAHHRFSSDLPVTLSAVQNSKSDNAIEQPGIAFPRHRNDSAVTSTYNNTQASFATGEDSSTPPSRSGGTAPGPKHKLFVPVPGEPPIVYQFGNRIGKGQFGSVYRALNMNTGQMVAVKSINLEGRSEEEVTQLMHEVVLLKSLSHPSVVKYEGLVREPEALSIILEFVENGSLLSQLKAFGNFPEKLIASYVIKILEGLTYLHEQGVVHCDLKAANILTTKSGNIKLSDFGVSLNLKAMEKIKNHKKEAVGTPNWMAPEVIELRGASTAADIWSLACTIIELLTGRPPYGGMMAMSAMFRIVVDDCPPIPEVASEELKDLLRQCFKKEPTERPTAEQLFGHPWLDQVWRGQKDLRPQDSVPALRRISADLRRLDPSTFIAVPESPTLERSTSSPPPSSSRRPFFAARLASTSAIEGRASIGDVSRPGLSLITPTPVHGGNPIISLMDEGDLDRTQFADSTVVDHDEILEVPKAHAFVKSTFSKPLQCRICKEKVKKHAVLCEECGLLCHASCANQAPLPCNLRAHLLLASARPSADLGRVTSPAPSLTPSMPQSPAFSPVSFRFPFVGKRRTSKGSESMQPFSPSPFGTSPNDLPSPVAGSTGSQGKESGGQVKRASFMPSRSSSTDSPFSSDLHHRSSLSSSQDKQLRRQSTMSYGSISGASSISSISNLSVARSPSSDKPATAVLSPVQSTARNITSSRAMGMVSTPHLSMDLPRPSHQAENSKHRRRVSVGVTSHFADRHDNLQRGQITPRAAAASGDLSGDFCKRNRRETKECVVM